MELRLDLQDQQMLDGKFGPAAKLAMSVIVRMANILEVSELLDISQAHIDACGLMSDSGLEFVETFSMLGGRVRVPTTLNMVPLDLHNWRSQGIDEKYASKAERLAKAYLDLGCIPTWTCAPYQGYLTPRFGQQIAWGESNAIAYANSALGARTERYADFMDLCVAITGRAPLYGLHLKENRKGQILFRLVGFDSTLFLNDTFYPVLGFLVGRIAQNRIPVIEGLDSPVSSDQLKALGAAAASSGGVGLFHIIGVTPEAATYSDAFQDMSPQQIVDIHPSDIQEAQKDLSTTNDHGIKIDAVIVGCPHMSFNELRTLAQLIEQGKNKLHPNTRFIITTNQLSAALLDRSGYRDSIIGFGAEIVTDTCVFHCPLLSPDTKVIMTNSGKFAYYAPGELNTQVVFGSLAECFNSAIHGTLQRGGF